jgi:hypothetical protein
MKTTKRFENAVMKLYNAFHNNELDANSCTHCAVGNICGTNEDYWFMTSTENIKDGKLSKIESDFFRYPESEDYSSKELYKIELVFLEQWRILKSDDWKNKEIQFKGLCAVVEYLAELDNIPNPMDYTKLFETENDKPKYQLA